MDIKIGANGDLNLNMTPAGDLRLQFSEKDTLTDETVQVDLHPKVLGDSLVKLLGGAAWVQGLVNVIIAELSALIPSDAPAPLK